MEAGTTEIRLERKEDRRAVEEIVRSAFYDVYCPGAREHYVLHRFREDPSFIKDLDLVLTLNDKTIGQIMFVEAFIEKRDGSRVPVLTFGPVSIAPDFQKEGYGKRLISFAIEKARQKKYPIIAITGNPEYYCRFGFRKGKEVGVCYKEDPKADYFLVLELKDGGFEEAQGSYRDPKGYFVAESDRQGFEAFDRTFR